MPIIFKIVRAIYILETNDFLFYTLFQYEIIECSNIWKKI